MMTATSRLPASRAKIERSVGGWCAAVAPSAGRVAASSVAEPRVIVACLRRGPGWTVHRKRRGEYPSCETFSVGPLYGQGPSFEESAIAIDRRDLGHPSPRPSPLTGGTAAPGPAPR